MARYADRAAVGAAVELISPQIPTLSPRLVPLITASLAKIAIYPGDAVVEGLAVRGADVAADCPPKALAWLVWGLSLMGDTRGARGVGEGTRGGDAM